MDDERERQIEERQREREERHRERGERRRERWELRRSDPIGPVIGALVLIWLGVIFLAVQNPEPDQVAVRASLGTMSGRLSSSG